MTKFTARGVVRVRVCVCVCVCVCVHLCVMCDVCVTTVINCKDLWEVTLAVNFIVQSLLETEIID